MIIKLVEFYGMRKEYQQTKMIPAENDEYCKLRSLNPGQHQLYSFREEYQVLEHVLLKPENI